MILVTAPTSSVAVIVSVYVPGFTVVSTLRTARLLDCVIVKPAIDGVPASVNTLLPVPCVAVKVSQATIPEVVVIVDVVLSTRIGGFTVIVYTREDVAPVASVAVTVSVMVRATVVLVDVKVFARLRVNAFAVDVSIVAPAFALVIVKVFVSVPCTAPTFEIEPATPCVMVAAPVPEPVEKKRPACAL